MVDPPIHVNHRDHDGWSVIETDKECWIDIRYVSHGVACKVAEYVMGKDGRVVIKYPSGSDWGITLESKYQGYIVQVAEVLITGKIRLPTCRWSDWGWALRHMVLAYRDIEDVMITSLSLEALRADLLSANKVTNARMIGYE